jgi:hypothetical protein
VILRVARSAHICCAAAGTIEDRQKPAPCQLKRNPGSTNAGNRNANAASDIEVSVESQPFAARHAIVAKVARSATKPTRLRAEKSRGSSVVVAEVGSLSGTPRVPLEELMKFLTRICMPVVALGAAVIAAPAMAQDDAISPSNSNAAAATPAQPAQDANNAAIPAQTAQDQTAMNGQAANGGASASSSSSTSAGNSQMAMNTTGNAADLSSIPDTRQKYIRAKRNADNQSEDETTKQLNQKESTLNGASGGNAQ